MGGGRGRRRDADGIDRSRIVDAAAPLSVFMHTNRAVRNATREFTLSKGWWADTHDLRPLQRKYQRSEFPCAPHCKGMGGESCLSTGGQGLWCWVNHRVRPRAFAFPADASLCLARVQST